MAVLVTIRAEKAVHDHSILGMMGYRRTLAICLDAVRVPWEEMAEYTHPITLAPTQTHSALTPAKALRLALTLPELVQNFHSYAPTRRADGLPLERRTRRTERCEP